MRRLAFTPVSVLIISSVLMQSACSGGAARVDQNKSRSGGTDPGSAVNSSAAPKPEPSVAAASHPTAPYSSFKGCNLYYPLAPGSKASYSIAKPSGPVDAVTVEVTESNEKGKKVFVEIAKEIVARSTTPGTQTTTRKYVCDGDKIDVVSSTIESKNPKGETGTLEGQFRSTAVVMIAPSSLKPGASWSYIMEAVMKLHERPERKQDTFASAFEVKGPEDVTVTAGTFHAIRIAVKINGHEADDYYAPGVGLVRRRLSDGTTWELKEYSGLTPLEKP